jgi:hypothetical protein
MIGRQITGEGNDILSVLVSAVRIDFCAVPVFPAIVNRAPPQRRRFPIAHDSAQGVTDLPGRFRRDDLAHHHGRKCELIILPSDVVIDFTIRGVTSLPPFAIVAIADVICNGVTPTSCPIGMRVMEILLHVCGGRIIPLISPGQFNSGAFAKSESPDVFVKFLVADAQIASLAAPMLLDFIRMSRTLRSPYAR